jgi:hypothetical protein
VVEKDEKLKKPKYRMLYEKSLAIVVSSAIVASGAGLWLYEQEKESYEPYYVHIEQIDREIETVQHIADAYRNQFNQDDLRYRVTELREFRKKMIKKYDDLTPFKFNPIWSPR